MSLILLSLLLLENFLDLRVVWAHELGVQGTRLGLPVLSKADVKAIILFFVLFRIKA